MTAIYPPGENGRAVEASEAATFSPFDAFELSFIVASFLCLSYAIALPVLIYIRLDIVLVSDVSIYFIVAALALFFTGRAFDFTQRELRR
jgi:hypothetical protein